MKTALLLVDAQRDFLECPGLLPPPAQLIPNLAELLDACRTLRLPVIHVQTRIHPDGSDRMPHWVRSGHWACVDGTPGAEPPAALAPKDSEPVFRKRFFSAFGNADLEAALASLGIGRIVLAGLYLHACVRSTALDAYERGYEVWVAQDAVLSDASVEAPIVWEETFGPVAVILSAADLDEAIALANAVPQALVASLVTENQEAQRRFAESIEAGLLKLAPGSLAIHPEAPFGGWKSSRIGPPEHGAWDLEFYARPQAVYDYGLKHL